MIIRNRLKMRDKQYYRERFKDYPDVVTLEQFRKMLGGIGDSTASRLMRAGRVKES
jgi:hypothetical protein